MSRHQRDRHKALRAQRARWRPTAEQKLEQRLSAGYADMLFRGTEAPRMMIPEPSAAEQELLDRGGMPRGRAYQAVDEPTRNRLIDELLVGTAHLMRTRGTA